MLILPRAEVLSLFILPSAIKGPRATQLGTAEFAINNAVQKDCSCILDHSFDAPFACAVSFHFPLHFPLHSPFLFLLPCLSHRWLRPSLASGPGTDVTLTSSEPGQLWRRHATRFYFRDSVIQGGEPGFRMRWFFPAGPCPSVSLSFDLMLAMCERRSSDKESTSCPPQLPDNFGKQQSQCSRIFLAGTGTLLPVACRQRACIDSRFSFLLGYVSVRAGVATQPSTCTRPNPQVCERDGLTLDVKQGIQAGWGAGDCPAKPLELETGELTWL